jgi:hypothetical protein
MSVRSLRYSDLSLRLPKGSSALPIERDAWAFLDAAGITSALQQRAVVQLVRDLKKAQLWTKMKAIYPFVGGTATTHKWNLKDPQDTDAAFRLTFSGGWTHSSTGADPNGTNAYAVTHYIPSSQASLGSVSYGIYNREDTIAQSLNDMGCGIAAGNSAHMAMLCKLSNTFYADCWNNGIGRVQVANTDRRGFYVATRSSTTSFKAFKNNTQIGTTRTNTQNQADLDALTMKFSIAAFTTPTSIINYNSAQSAFAFIGDGLTDSEASLLYHCVDRYQKTLGRAV